MLAITAMKKVNKGSNPKDIPNGMPPLSSLIGDMAASRVRAISLTITCFNSASYDWEG